MVVDGPRQCGRDALYHWGLGNRAGYSQRVGDSVGQLLSNNPLDRRSVVGVVPLHADPEAFEVPHCSKFVDPVVPFASVRGLCRCVVGIGVVSDSGMSATVADWMYAAVAWRMLVPSLSSASRSA